MKKKPARLPFHATTIRDLSTLGQVQGGTSGTSIISRQVQLTQGCGTSLVVQTVQNPSGG